MNSGHGILLVDKPVGVSSHGVVSVARRALSTRRVGHAGTLDPMATGLLVLAVGEALKIVRYLALDDKRYEAVVQLGSETDTLDADGRVVAEAPVPDDLTLARVQEIARRFEGTIAQRPPAISALKQAGEPLYARARRGEAVEPKERDVHVHALQIRFVGDAQVELSVHSGKGFYVRALARDLAQALGTVGHLRALRRTQSGRFALTQSIEFQRLLAAKDNPEEREGVRHALIPIEQALEGAPRITLDAEGAQEVLHGKVISPGRVVRGALPEDELEPLLLCNEAGRLLAVARYAASTLRVVRGFRF